MLFIRGFPIIFSSFQVCVGIFLAPKPNLEWEKIMKKATYNLCHPYNNVTKDARNNYEIFVDKCLLIIKNLMCFLFLIFFIKGISKLL